jgi:hypothetical protein
MDRENAARLAAELTRLPALANAYPQLTASLTSLLPELDAATVVKLANSDVILGLAGKTLYEVHLDARATAVVRIQSRRLTAETASVRCEERVEAKPILTRTRKWEFALAANEEPIKLETEQLLRSEFADERLPPSSELFARALARELEWAVPEDDIGERLY